MMRVSPSSSTLPARLTRVLVVLAGVLLITGLAAQSAWAHEGEPDVCGNGVQEGHEQCDDGNLIDGDGCNSDCTCAIGADTNTFEAIQSVIFDSPTYDCTNAACHDSVLPQGNLNLETGQSYMSLLGADGSGAPSAGSVLDRVKPGEPAESFLYTKLAAKTLGTDPGGGAPMPQVGPALTEEHLQAMRVWIRSGAPRDLVVEGTGELLGTCLPPADPLKIPVPDPPPVGAGFQLQQTPWPLLGFTSESQGEDEICMATFYDFTATNLIPDSAKVPCPPAFSFRKGCSNNSNVVCDEDGDCGAGNTCVPVKVATNPGNECFAWRKQTLYQDPQSHHSIIHVYTGGADETDPAWGAWTYKFEDPDHPLNGQPCDPADVDPALGYNPGCSGEVVSNIACLGYGPADAGNFDPTGGGGGNLPGFSGSQETYYELEFADRVFSVLPARAIVVWNSHAFNLTATDSTMSQYLNIELARREDQRYPLDGIFMSDWIFAQNIPPFQTQEICGTQTLDQGSTVFQLGSHTHLRGVRWRTWLPPNAPCQPPCPTTACINRDPNGICLCENVPVLPICEGPRTDEPVYFSTEYSDPLNLRFDPPLVFNSPSVEDRTLLFCSLYDNGSTPTSPPVKQQSTSPLPPPLNIFGIPLQPEQLEFLGGPCPDSDVACIDGPNKGMPCGGDDSVCGGAGLCDACPVHGGVTTQDEMFILLGNFYLAPDSDGDGLRDNEDNCIDVPNPDQTDTDGDGCGNRCDADFNNDGVVGLADFGQYSANFGQTVPPGNPDVDCDGDGVIGLADFGCFSAQMGGPPGPGVACP